MKVYYDSDQDTFTVDLEGEALLSKNPIRVETDESASCDCLSKVRVKGETVLDVEQITVWNLLFNGDLKKLLKQIKSA